MKRIILFLLFLSFPISGCSALEQQDPYAWDFGRVEEGVILEHVFFFKNESKKTLNIKEVNTSCGCTVSQVKNKKLLPGESTPLEVSFDTKGYSGQVQQFIYLHTDSLDNPVIRFIIKAYVVKK